MYLVTGGAGFIGSNIAEKLGHQGKQVRVLDNLSTGRRENLRVLADFDSIEVIEGDITDTDVVERAMDGVEFVLHQAALPSVPRSIKDPISSNRVNVEGTLNLLEAARKAEVKRFVYASSSSLYGDPPPESAKLPKVEDQPLNPKSPYAVSKYAGERYTVQYYSLFGLETVALRYFNVFGPRQDPTSEYSAVIPKFISLIQRGKAPTIYGDGETSRDFTYIENNVRANLLACSVDGIGGEVFNIACGTSHTLNSLATTLGGLMGSSLEPEYAPERPGDVKHSLAAIEKARSLLGFEPGVGFEEGLRLTIDSLS